MKLFQIEEPDGSPGDPDVSGLAIGIDLTGAVAEVAVAVGGNAVVLRDREGFALTLPVPAANAAAAEWEELFVGARLRAERALARPVTHAVIATGVPLEPEIALRLQAAGAAAGLALLHILAPSEPPAGGSAALAAAVLAEDLAPRPAR